MNNLPFCNKNPQSSSKNCKNIEKMLQMSQYSFVKQAVQFIKLFLTQQTYPELYLSFNGGKDATVVLFLTLLALQKSSLKNVPIKCLYFKQPNSFQEVDAFIDDIKSKIQIEWHELSSKKYAKQLKQFKTGHPFRYILMGSRKGDPYCQNLGKIAPSDIQKGYPQFQRLNPIIFWSYEQVWMFLKDFEIPYCRLYDQGYTYLGNKSNCSQNKTLFDAENKKYKPAFEAKGQTQTTSRVTKIKQ